jgi:hypothetical protein
MAKSIVPGRISGKQIRFVDLERGPDLSGGFMEVQGFIPHISNLGEIVRMNTELVRWSPRPQIFLAIKFSCILKPGLTARRWLPTRREYSGFYYPSYYRDFFYGPFLHDDGSVSFFHDSESHFVTIFPKGVFIPPQPIDAAVRKNLWNLLKEI